MEEVASAKQHWAIESGTVNSVVADRGVREFGDSQSGSRGLPHRSSCSWGEVDSAQS
jgi:hypothetical protein